MSAKKSKKERKVIIKQAEQLIAKLATDELKEHYARIYALYMAEKKENLKLTAKIWASRVNVLAAIVTSIAALVIYLK